MGNCEHIYLMCFIYFTSFQNKHCILTKILDLPSVGWEPRWCFTNYSTTIQYWLNFSSPTIILSSNGKEMVWELVYMLTNPQSWSVIGQRHTTFSLKSSNDSCVELRWRHGSERERERERERAISHSQRTESDYTHRSPERRKEEEAKWDLMWVLHILSFNKIWCLL